MIFKIILIKNNNKIYKKFLNIIKNFLYYICKLNNLNKQIMATTTKFNLEMFKNGVKAQTKLGNPVKFITISARGELIVAVRPRYGMDEMVPEAITEDQILNLSLYQECENQQEDDDFDFDNAGWNICTTGIFTPFLRAFFTE